MAAALAVATDQSVPRPVADLPEVRDRLTRVRDHGEVGRWSVFRHDHGVLVDRQIPPALERCTMIRPRRIPRIGDLRALFVTHSGVDVDGPGCCQCDGIHLVVEETLCHNHPMAQVHCRLEVGKGGENLGRLPRAVQETAAVGLVGHGDTDLGFEAEGAREEFRRLVERPGIDTAVADDVVGLDRSGGVELLMKVREVSVHVGAERMHHDCQTEIVVGAESSQVLERADLRFELEGDEGECDAVPPGCRDVRDCSAEIGEWGIGADSSPESLVEVHAVSIRRRRAPGRPAVVRGNVDRRLSVEADKQAGEGMPEFTITRRIDASLETVWGVLDDFGDIQRWNPGVAASALTSEGSVALGTTRRCDFSPFGAVNERIDGYVPNQRLTVNIFEASKLPISDAVADFNIAPDGDATELTLHYRYTLNRLGRLAKGTTDKQMRKGINGLVDGLQKESERVAASA